MAGKATRLLSLATTTTMALSSRSLPHSHARTRWRKVPHRHRLPFQHGRRSRDCPPLFDLPSSSQIRRSLSFALPFGPWPCLPRTVSNKPSPACPPRFLLEGVCPPLYPDPHARRTADLAHSDRPLLQIYIESRRLPSLTKIPSAPRVPDTSPALVLLLWTLPIAPPWYWSATGSDLAPRSSHSSSTPTHDNDLDPSSTREAAVHVRLALRHFSRPARFLLLLGDAPARAVPHPSVRKAEGSPPRALRNRSLQLWSRRSGNRDRRRRRDSGAPPSDRVRSGGSSSSSGWAEASGARGMEGMGSRS